MRTDVSSRPRSGRCPSATRRRVLARGGLEIAAQPLVVDARRGPEHRHRRLRCDKAMATKRSQLTDRHAVARHDERFPPIELAHDLSALVAQLSLGDLAAHVATVARCATYRRLPVHT